MCRKVSLVSLLALACTFFAARAAHATDYVNDPMTDPGFPGRGNKGGSFSANGWTVQTESDAFWYEIPDALPTGHVEYTVTGLSLATSLLGNDHDILTLYQAPSGMAEPIAYMPGFRNNDFKVFTRIFGALETGRPGAMKLELAFCPRGDPWYHDAVCDASCDGSGLAYANGNQNDLGWDANTPYRMGLSWGNGQFTFYRDQVALGTVNYPGEWSPQPLRIRWSSPRHDNVYPGAAFMPIGITIKDVLIQGTAGNMTPICGATVDDGGTPPPPDDASPGNAWEALADITAASWEPAVYSVITDLNVEADTNFQPTAVVYLRFPAITGSVQKAVLRVHTGADSSAAGGSGIVCSVADDTWSETTMTWANRPPVGTTCAGAPSSVDPDMDVEWDVTALVKSGASVDLAVVSTDSNGAHYMSKEAGDSTKSPHLLVEVGPAPDGSTGGGGATGNGGSGGTWSDAGIQVGGKSGSAGNRAAGGTDDAESGGCGCRSATGSASAFGALAFLALAGLGIRRRR